jgi:hypothetical protein
MRQTTLVMLLTLAASLAHAQELNDRTLGTLRTRILPRPDELLWREIPWREALWPAVAEASAADKPILLWAMNGHPLACT